MGGIPKAHRNFLQVFFRTHKNFYGRKFAHRKIQDHFLGFPVCLALSAFPSPPSQGASGESTRDKITGE